MKHKILILGGDGYLGWPTAMYFAKRGHAVAVLDGLNKRNWEERVGIAPLLPLPTFAQRVRLWNTYFPEHAMKSFVTDLCDNHLGVYQVFETFLPDTVIHYAEQPSAPFSMKDRNGAFTTMTNNIGGTTNVVYAMKEFTPDAHLIKLGTMGEYGTPGIPIQEGWFTTSFNGQSVRLPFPKLPGSIYHASKVADSVMLEFLCRAWNIRVTDLNQGVVYGIDTAETQLHDELRTSFHYDEMFGTVLNRFIVQAVVGQPLTVYGRGGQTRGFLNIKDTLQCVGLATAHPADPGEFRVFNQFTECFSVSALAEIVKRVGDQAGFKVEIAHMSNPRVEKESHFYQAENTSLLQLGLKPNYLTDEVVTSMMDRVARHKGVVDPVLLNPKTKWR